MNIIIMIMNMINNNIILWNWVW